MNLFTDQQHFAFMRRMGAAAFLFFFVKGLMWLAAPLFFMWFV